MKISVYLATSVNGMISNSRNVPDWLSQEYGMGFMSICQRTKAVIMGKTTYNILAPDHLPLKDDGSLVVLTHDTSMKSPQANVLFTDKKPREILSLLEARGHTEAVIIGGTATVDAFMNAGVVDELLIYFAPHMLGDAARGVFDLGELTEMNKRLQLNIQETRMIGPDLRILARPVVLNPGA